MNDKHGMILSRDVCSEDCIYLAGLPERLYTQYPIMALSLKGVAEHYRLLLDLLYEQGYEPFATPPQKPAPTEATP